MGGRGGEEVKWEGGWGGGEVGGGEAGGRGGEEVKREGGVRR